MGPEQKSVGVAYRVVVQTIDANGGYYQKALQPIFSDQVGRCGPEVEREYKKKIKEIMDKHRK